jgi:hypothetical protein
MLARSGERKDITICTGDYLNAFERINMVPGTIWNKPLARANADRIRAKMEGRTTVLLGRVVPACLGWKPPPWMVWCSLDSGKWMNIPHPSGMTREYNSAEFRRRVGDLLLELYQESVGQAT